MIHWKALFTTYFVGQRGSGSCAQCTRPTDRQHPSASQKKKRKTQMQTQHQKRVSKRILNGLTSEGGD